MYLHKLTRYYSRTYGSVNNIKEVFMHMHMYVCMLIDVH